MAETKTVKIVIEVEVSDEASHVAVDMDGLVSYRLNDGTEDEPAQMDAKWNNRHHARVVNWRETLTEVE